VIRVTDPVHGLSDKALAVFAFAAYHQLESGQRVSKVVQRDDSGHRADADAVHELSLREFVRADGEHIHFTEEGERVLQALIGELRRTVGAG
jgi:hypothetical protein